MTTEILYYTDNRMDKGVFAWIGPLVRSHIQKSGLHITSISLKPLDFGDNIVFEGRRSHQTMFRQILAGLRACTADFIFMCEHDVLYHPSHFTFVPPRDDVYYYNKNVWKWRLSDNKVIGYDCCWLSQNCSARKILIEHYEKKLAIIESGQRAYGYEPGTGQSKSFDAYPAENWESEFPNIDIRHGKNWTGVDRMDPSEFRSKRSCQNWRETTIDKVPYWDLTSLAKKWTSVS